MYNPNLEMNTKDFQSWMNENYPDYEVKLHRNHLQQFLQNPFGHKGAFIATIEAETDPRFTKKDRITKETFPYEVKKVQETQIIGNAIYENCVNNSRIRLWNDMDGQPLFNSGLEIPPANADGSAPEYFNASPRKWGERLKGTPFVIHTKKGSTVTRYYMDALCLRSLSVRYESDEAEIAVRNDCIVINGKVWDVMSAKNKEQQANHQGLTVENMVTWRDYALDSITGIRYAGRRFVVTNN